MKVSVFTFNAHLLLFHPTPQRTQRVRKYAADGSISPEYQAVIGGGFTDSLIGREEDFATFAHGNSFSPLGLDGLPGDSRLDYIFLITMAMLFN